MRLLQMIGPAQPAKPTMRAAIGAYSQRSKMTTPFKSQYSEHDAFYLRSPMVITRGEIDWALEQFDAALAHPEAA
jgi:hypothetical protein